MTPADQHCCLSRQRPRPAPAHWGRLLRGPPGEHTRHVDTQALWPPGTRGVGADPEADAGAPQTQPGVPPRAVPATGSPRGCGHSLRLHGPLGGPGPLAPPGPRGLAHGLSHLLWLTCLPGDPACRSLRSGRRPPELVRVGDVSRVGLSPVMRTQRPRRVEEGGGRGDVAAGLRRGPATPRELGEASRRPPQPRREPLAHAWPRTCASTAVQGQISAAQAAECGTWPWQPREARRLDECSLHVPVDAHAALDSLSSVETLRMVRKPAFEVPLYQQEQSLRSNFHSD